MRPTPQLQRILREEGGFSLVEMLATLVILLIVVGTLTVLMVSATNSEVDLTQRVRAQQETRLALEAMRRDVHCASSTSIAQDVASALVTLTIPSTCPSADGATSLTWCTSGSGSRFALRRISGTTGTCTGGRPVADYLTNQNPFTLQRGAGKLDKICVVFPVDLDPTDTRRAYRLKDELVLRNSTRATTGDPTC